MKRKIDIVPFVFFLDVLDALLVYSTHNTYQNILPFRWSNPFKYFHWNYREVQSITLATDGIDSYVKNGEPVDVSEAFHDHKRTTGDFVKSNMLFHRKKMIKEGIRHLDDIAVATVEG